MSCQHGGVERGVALAACAMAIIAALIGRGSPVAAQTMDDEIYTYVSFDELEYVPGATEEPIEYDGQMWIGGDFERLWLKVRGEQSTLERAGLFEGQALFSRTTSAFWNTQVGLRIDRLYSPGPDATRGLLAVGVQGLAPYWFEVESFLYVSHEGDVSARVEASYELLFTQRLILEPEIELNGAVQDVPSFGVGSGLNDVELGARVRYEVVREFAPYVGISWKRSFGETADMIRLVGLPVSDANFVAGLRWWY